MGATTELVPAGEAERRTGRSWRELLREPLILAQQDAQRRWWFDPNSLDRYAAALPAPAFTVVKAPPVDDLDDAHKRLSQLVTEYHRAGVVLAQSAEHTAAATKRRAEALLALEAMSLTAQRELRDEVMQSLALLPTVRYTKEPNGSWTLSSPYLDATCTSPVPA